MNPCCKFCTLPVDPTGERAIINHEYAHVDCMSEDWNRAARAHAELNRLETEINASTRSIQYALDRIFHP